MKKEKRQKRDERRENELDTENSYCFQTRIIAFFIVHAFVRGDERGVKRREERR